MFRAIRVGDKVPERASFIHEDLIAALKLPVHLPRRLSTKKNLTAREKAKQSVSKWRRTHPLKSSEVPHSSWVVYPTGTDTMFQCLVLDPVGPRTSLPFHFVCPSRWYIILGRCLPQPLPTHALLPNDLQSPLNAYALTKVLTDRCFCFHSVPSDLRRVCYAHPP